jgi:hypothetical protein
MKSASLLALVLSMLAGQILFAKDLLIPKPGDRRNYIKQGKVWVKPNWISENFEFSNDLDVYSGGPVKSKDKLLLNDHVTCKMTEETAKDRGNGKTPKFKCLLMEYIDGKPVLVLSKKGKADDIKVKYGVDNAEIYAEVIATRLLWALGFGADRMFQVDNVICYGCTEEPFKDRRVDQSTMMHPRIMFGNAIERKMEGLNMIYDNPPQSNRPGNGVVHRYPEEGWNFSELMNALPKDKREKYDEKTKRDALRLLSVFMQHVDSKAENHRLICENEELDSTGKCQGPIRLILQDVGATFGGGTLINKLRISKVELEKWSEKSIWRDAKNCFAKFGLSGDFNLMRPQISEEGRQFLSRLLVGFSSGTAGRKRVEDLFRAARIERREGTVNQWTEAFLDKVRQIQYPLGESQPDFRCPKSITD